MAFNGRASRRRAERELQRHNPDGSEQSFDVVGYFSPGENHLVVRRWEMLGLIAWIRRIERHHNRLHRKVWRALRGGPWTFDAVAWLPVAVAERRRMLQEQTRATASEP